MLIMNPVTCDINVEYHQYTRDGSNRVWPIYFSLNDSYLILY